MERASGSLLEVRDFAIRYGKKQTVQGVGFSLAPGEVLSLVGESGSGKTSVIRALLGCLGGGGTICGGAAFFEGRDLTQLSEEAWKKLRGRELSMIFQDTGAMLNPVRKIGSQFIEYILLHTHSIKTKEEARKRCCTLLGRMNLANPESILGAYPFELSGGMRQRVGIAMALAFHPKLLLADEPTAALDVTTQAQIVAELLRIVRESRTAMILVTHNIGVAACVSDKILVMSGGRVLEYGATQDILHAPKSDYTKKLLASVPTLGGRRYVE